MDISSLPAVIEAPQYAHFAVTAEAKPDCGESKQKTDGATVPERAPQDSPQEKPNLRQLQ
jgi:hypothetical protein